MNPLLLTDFYKIGHPVQYPRGTQIVYSNFTPRTSRLPGIDKMIFFGLRYFIHRYLEQAFERHFFGRSKETVVNEYDSVVQNGLGTRIDVTHIKDLHDLGYLPLRIDALPEGTAVPMRVPPLTIFNTHPKFAWLTNRIETLMSAVLWQPCTSATIARAYRQTLGRWAQETGVEEGFVPWQGHDFSFRGMGSVEAAITSGMGHLTSFNGTDTIPAILAAQSYYDASPTVGGSVPATEHSVMCVEGEKEEFATFERLLETYPTGVLSIVSDTWNLWRVLTEYLPRLKNKVLARPGKLVIRPDSGDPVDILCGAPDSTDPSVRAGVVELLWDVFGGTYTDQGYRLLDSHVGAIYGDSITLSRADAINRRLAKKGFASQVVFGIGSYTYQYNTRDTFGTAIKSTYAVVNGEAVMLQKDPVTDDGTKRSATGLLQVLRGPDGELYLNDGFTEPPEVNLLQQVWNNGEWQMDSPTFDEIRDRISEQNVLA